MPQCLCLRIVTQTFNVNSFVCTELTEFLVYLGDVQTYSYTSGGGRGRKCPKKRCKVIFKHAFTSAFTPQQNVQRGTTERIVLTNAVSTVMGLLMPVTMSMGHVTEDAALVMLLRYVSMVIELLLLPFLLLFLPSFFSCPKLKLWFLCRCQV